MGKKLFRRSKNRGWGGGGFLRFALNLLHLRIEVNQICDIIVVSVSEVPSPISLLSY